MGVGEGERELLWGQMVLDMWGVPRIILNSTSSPTENAQYFTLFKLDTRRCEKPILTCHYILHPQPPQPKSCTSFYADYNSFIGENISYIYIYIYIYHHKKDVFHWRLPKKLVSNMDIAKHMLPEADIQLKSALIKSTSKFMYVNISCLPTLATWLVIKIYINCAIRQLDTAFSSPTPKPTHQITKITSQKTINLCKERLYRHRCWSGRLC